MALDADLCGSTQSVVIEKNFPERYFEMGIGEQNMISVAAGLALTGKIPFAHSFSVFASGLSPTGTSTVNYTDASIANFFMSALSTGGALTVRCGSNAAHCIIDVMGFLY